MIRFLITIPRDLHGELKETAAQRGQTLTGLIRGILWDWISQHSGETPDIEGGDHDGASTDDNPPPH